MQMDYTFERQLTLEREDARSEGRATGLEEGVADRKNEINKLNSMLLEQNRLENIKKSVVDREFQEKLLEEMRKNEKKEPDSIN